MYHLKIASSYKLKEMFEKIASDVGFKPSYEMDEMVKNIERMEQELLEFRCFPTVQTMGDDDKIYQVQLQGLSNDNIWQIRANGDGIVIHQPASKPTLCDISTIRAFGEAILDLCNYQEEIQVEYGN